MYLLCLYICATYKKIYFKYFSLTPVVDYNNMYTPRPATDSRSADLVATFNDSADMGLYTMRDYTAEKRAVRPVLMEDRMMPVEQLFFCDRATEKTIIMTVIDNQNVPRVK